MSGRHLEGWVPAVQRPPHHLWELLLKLMVLTSHAGELHCAAWLPLVGHSFSEELSEMVELGSVSPDVMPSRVFPHGAGKSSLPGRRH